MMVFLIKRKNLCSFFFRIYKSIEISRVWAVNRVLSEIRFASPAQKYSFSLSNFHFPIFLTNQYIFIKPPIFYT